MEDLILDAHLYEDERYMKNRMIYLKMYKRMTLYALQLRKICMIGPYGPHSSLVAAPRAPPHESCPCCEHKNMLRQILQQMEKLIGKVDELNRKVNMSEEQRQRSLHLHRDGCTHREVETSEHGE
ncbi:hypothetical protein Fot_11656 [Forsythia ovata]|uniref:Uncharacterized protein n=1 Tax=Forsythia ovata TaxID=205694 RepID=A0ABD1WKA8_9LAMI